MRSESGPVDDPVAVGSVASEARAFRWIDVPATSDVTLRALSWEPDRVPIALCLPGFPDTSYGWRAVAPRRLDAGWRVVAPFVRSYAPSSPSSVGSYHIGALMRDALRVLEAAGPTGHDVVVGQDWGAGAGAGLAAMPRSPFTKAVLMSVPPVAAFRGRWCILASRRCASLRARTAATRGCERPPRVPAACSGSSCRASRSREPATGAYVPSRR